jgi:hypothetical protein
MDKFMESAVTIAVAIIGLATIAVLVSRNANTAGVIGAGGGALAQGIEAATAPVTGGSFGNAVNGGYGGLGFDSYENQY